jgi:hypothetical protein
VQRRVISHKNLPRWANASEKLIEYAEKGGTFEALFKKLDSGSQDKLTFDQVKKFRDEYIRCSDQFLQFAFYSHDKSHDRHLGASEFKAFLEQLTVEQAEDSKQPAEWKSYQTMHEKLPLLASGAGSINSAERATGTSGSEEAHEEQEEEDVEEEEAEEDHKNWSERQKKYFALLLLFVGTGMVILFSDPMVDTITGFARSVGISAFYVSFVITPIASNASEVISGLIFAGKKTNRSMSLTLSSLYGAATMNNTFCLAIFLALVYFRSLSWDFSAEVMAILLVNWGVGFIGSRETVTLWQAGIVLMLYPTSLLLVWFLETVCGMS